MLRALLHLSGASTEETSPTSDLEADLINPGDSHPRPFRREGIWKRIGPFVAAGFCTVAVLPFQELDKRSPAFWIASGLTPLIVVLALVLPWKRWPGWVQATLPLTLLGIVGLLRDASGAADSVYTPVILLGILWLALYGTPSELAASLVCLGGVFALPYLVQGSPRYPMQDLSEGFAYAILGLFVGLAIQRLLRKLTLSTEQLQILSRTDPLTGVPNRRVWDERLRLELGRSERSNRPLSIVLIDLDNFKLVNDRDGHEAGDDHLKEVAAAWLGLLRRTDQLVRFGGDEFGLILPDSPLPQAAQLLERLRLGIPRGHTCSAGLVMWDGNESPAQLVARADRALYEAKRRGRDRVEVGEERR